MPTKSNLLHNSLTRETLQDEINKLTVAVDQSANVILITKPDGQIEYVNHAFTKITGYKPKEVVGQNPRVLKSGIQPSSFYENMWKTLIRGDQWKGEFQNRKKNGEIFWESATITPVKNNEGKIVRYIAIKEDITKQKQAEKSLRESEEQYKSMVSNIPGVLYRCAPDSKRTAYYITDAIETLTGFGPEEFLYNKIRSYASIIHPDDVEPVMSKIQSSLTHPDSYNLEYRIITSDKDIKWVADNGRPVFDENRTLKWFDGFVFDISDRIFVLEELKKAKIQAEEANKAKSEFLANISHEIRTPLNAVLGFAELLEKMNTDTTQLQYLNSIKSSGNNLMTLINDLLDLSKIEAGRINLQYASFRLRDLFAEIWNIFYLRAETKGIQFKEILSRNFPSEITFDETRLRQILINLVGNAIKFTHEGHVILDARAKYPKTKKGISSMLFEIRIKDTGIGIPEDSFQAIFDSFRQESQLDSRKYKGTGLGLAITKRLVEAMNGSIDLESEVGKGTTFTIRFTGVNFTDKAKGDRGVFEKMTASGNPVLQKDQKRREKPLKRLKPDKYNDLIDKLEIKLFKQWNHFKIKKPLKEVKSFAAEIIRLGKETRIDFVKEYGEQLYLTIENFDIEEMQLKLEEYPDLLTKLKKIPHESRRTEHPDR